MIGQTNRFAGQQADACVYLMNLPDERFVPLLEQDRNDGLAPLVNIGVGHDLTIRELAEVVRREYQKGRCPDVERLDNRPASLFVEAVK